MNELSDAEQFGSRQTRRDASMARSRTAEWNEAEGDNTRRRESPMDGAGESRRGAGASDERRKDSPSALESDMRGSNRGRKPSGTIRFEASWKPRDPKTYSCMASGRRGDQIAQNDIARTVATIRAATLTGTHGSGSQGIGDRGSEHRVFPLQSSGVWPINIGCLCSKHPFFITLTLGC